MGQVDPQAVPGGGTAAHRRLEEVCRLQVRGRLGMASPPPVQACGQLRLGRGPTQLDHRDRGASPARGGGARARPDPLAGHLGPARARARAPAGPERCQPRVLVPRGHGGCARRGNLRRRSAPGPAPGGIVPIRPTLPRRLDPRRLPGLLRVLGRPRRVAQALGLVSGGELKQGVQGPHRAIDPGPGITPLPEQCGHRGQREVLRDHQRHLVPAEWERDPGVRRGPHGVRGGHGAVLGVLVVVDEHAVPLLLPPLGGGEGGGAALHVAGEGQGRAADLREAPATLDAHVDVDPARAGRLRPANEAHVRKGLLDHQRHLADLRPGHARHRVQVHAQLVRVVQVIGAHRVRVQVQAAQVRDPGETRGLVHHQLVRGAPGREGQRGRPHPLGRVLGSALLEERLLLGAVHEALERHRPPAHAHQGAIGHREEVPDQVQLRVTGLREVELVRVADGHLATADDQDLLRRRHGGSVGASPSPTSRPGRRCRLSLPVASPLGQPGGQRAPARPVAGR